MLLQVMCTWLPLVYSIVWLVESLTCMYNISSMYHRWQSLADGPDLSYLMNSTKINFNFWIADLFLYEAIIGSGWEEVA